MSVYRPQVGEAHILEHTTGQQRVLQGLFQVVGEAVDLPAHKVAVHHPAVEFFKGEVLGLQPLAG